MRESDDAAVIEAARLADVHEMILRLPEGYNTDVGLHGHRLSGGQKQRIALARALFGEPALIVLDEPNSNLDNPGEQALLRSLVKLKRHGRTILVVAHQPSTLRTADKVLVLKEGMVEAFGEREEVLRSVMRRPAQQRVVPMRGSKEEPALPAPAETSQITKYLRARHQGSEDDGAALPLSKVIRGPKVIGYAAIVLFFGGFGAWATIASLASAAIAPGLVSPDGNRKTVEHLEGGIVREIRVREGDHVNAGQVLVVLEDVRARAEFEELQERFVHLISIEARLLAELAEADSIAPPAQLDDYDPEIFRPALSAQQRLFESRQATLQGREKILGQRVLQLQADSACSRADRQRSRAERRFSGNVSYNSRRRSSACMR
jgi:ABC-type glutathione transport system ATPase component